MSQSLWSRDYFLIPVRGTSLASTKVAIPLEQGLFFNDHWIDRDGGLASQSLWSRDYFLIAGLRQPARSAGVAIPLEQGLFFNLQGGGSNGQLHVAIPLEQGLFFNTSLLISH